MKHDPVYIKLDWSDAIELDDLLKRINAMHQRAIQHFDIAPSCVTISEYLDVFKPESIALAKTLDQLRQQF